MLYLLSSSTFAIHIITIYSFNLEVVGVARSLRGRADIFMIGLSTLDCCSSAAGSFKLPFMSQRQREG